MYVREDRSGDRYACCVVITSFYNRFRAIPKRGSLGHRCGPLKNVYAAGFYVQYIAGNR